MKHKIRLFLILFCGFYVCYPQSDSSASHPSLFFLNAGYRVHLGQQRIINSGNGLSIELGINLGKFINNNLILAVYGGWACRDGLWSTAFKSRFVADYKNAINHKAGFSGLDSALISSSQDLFASKKGRSAALPGCETKTFNNYALYYGLMLKPPVRWLPVIKLYAGFTHTFYRGGNIITNKSDYNSVSLSRPMKGCELMLFSRDILNQQVISKYPALARLALSAYLEVYNFSQSTLKFDDGSKTTALPFSRFTDQAFTSRYHNDKAFGVRLSILLM